MKKKYSLSYTKDNALYYEALDGETVAYTGGLVNKTNVFSVDSKGELKRSLCLDKEVICVRGHTGSLTVFRR